MAVWHSNRDVVEFLWGRNWIYARYLYNVQTTKCQAATALAIRRDRAATSPSFLLSRSSERSLKAKNEKKGAPVFNFFNLTQLSFNMKFFTVITSPLRQMSSWITPDNEHSDPQSEIVINHSSWSNRRDYKWLIIIIIIIMMNIINVYVLRRDF